MIIPTPLSYRGDKCYLHFVDHQVHGESLKMSIDNENASLLKELIPKIGPMMKYKNKVNGLLREDTDKKCESNVQPDSAVNEQPKPNDDLTLPTSHQSANSMERENEINLPVKRGVSLDESDKDVIVHKEPRLHFDPPQRLNQVWWVTTNNRDMSIDVCTI